MENALLSKYDELHKCRIKSENSQCSDWPLSLELLPVVIGGGWCTPWTVRHRTDRQPFASIGNLKSRMNLHCEGKPEGKHSSGLYARLCIFICKQF